MVKSDVRPQRSDWRRNHEQLLSVAAELIARDGAEVSLEEIARRAGVGSATLHRHFSSRQALLEEVFRDAVERLRRRAVELTGDDPSTALLAWLDELTVAATETRGLAAALVAGDGAVNPEVATCHEIVREATTVTVDRARAVAAVRQDITPDDVLALVEGISLVTEGDPSRAQRLLRIVLEGMRGASFTVLGS